MHRAKFSTVPLPWMPETKYEIECFYFYAKMETEVGRIKGIHHAKEVVFVLISNPKEILALQGYYEAVILALYLPDL